MPTDASTHIDFLDELAWRGLLKDCTDLDGLRAHLADPDSSPRKVYCGFDPTADSLTIGNLVPIMCLAHLKRAGHHPVVVMGGGTGLIGDPSGKSAERQLRTPEEIEGYINKQRPIFAEVLGDEGTDFTLANNADWLTAISYIEALRDIGKHFSVNMMMQKESVKDRLNNREQGISYTEFSYMILQAYDFAHLYEANGVTVQLGGSDQYGNIVAGTELIRKRHSGVRKKVLLALRAFRFDTPLPSRTIGGREYDLLQLIEAHDLFQQEDIRADFHSLYPEMLREVLDWSAGPGQAAMLPPFLQIIADAEKSVLPTFGLTAPLVQKADGGKFGKTESGAVWLTAARTSPYAYYQFWLNASDEDIPNFLRTFTFLTKDEIEALESAHAAEPGKREAQRRLAQEATRILHGEAAMAQAEAAGKALFSGDITGLDLATLNEVFASVPSFDRDKAELAGEGVNPIELLKAVGAASSNREAREFIGNGSVSINGTKLREGEAITENHLLHSEIIAIRRGKKKWFLTRWK